MNSWAKMIKEGSKKGYEFWGTWATGFTIYKDGTYIGNVATLAELKTLMGIK